MQVDPVEQRLRRCDIARKLARFGVADDSSRVDDEGAGELAGIAFGFAQVRSGERRAQAARVEPGIDEIAPAGAAKPVGAISDQFAIPEHRERQIEIGPELRRALGRALTDRDDGITALDERGVGATQLRRMLAAEYSAEMAEKDQNQSALRRFPPCAERARLALFVAQDDIGRRVADRRPDAVFSGFRHHAFASVANPPYRTRESRRGVALSLPGDANVPNPRSFRMYPIGSVERSGADVDPAAFYDPARESILVIEARWAEGLAGIEGYSHLVVLFALDRAKRRRIAGPLRAAEGREGAEPVGFFATRTPKRPNPIGIACPRLLRRDGNRLHVTGIDAWPGTPILDIKGYSLRDEFRPDATVPKWLLALWQAHDEDGPRR